MMRTGRGTADRARRDAPPAPTLRDRIHSRFPPEQLHGNGLAIAILLSVLLYGLVIVTVLHLIARLA